MGSDERTNVTCLWREGGRGGGEVPGGAIVDVGLAGGLESSRKVAFTSAVCLIMQCRLMPGIQEPRLIVLMLPT